MKTIFIPAISKAKIDYSYLEKLPEKLPENIAITYSVQYKFQALEIKNYLEKIHKVKQFIQILGCSELNFSKSVQAILVISDGKFHAVSLASKTNLPVYLYNLQNLIKVSEKEIREIKTKQKSSYLNYLNSEKVGILISTKPGQEKIKSALKINISKSRYFFLSNNIDINEFENFPQISSWINTACPKLELDSNKIINIANLNSCNAK